MKFKTILFAIVIAVSGCSYLLAQSGASTQNAQHLTCSSDDGSRHYCNTDTRGGVQMQQQRSGSPCIQGQTWGYDNNGIWVNHGCRADFIVNPYNPSMQGQGGNALTCSSDDGNRHYCNADTRGGVQMQQQRSGSPCTQGQTWGYDRNGIWVDHGCRADFIVNPYNPSMQGQGGNTVTCSSDDGNRHYCNADTRGGVQMQQQRSGSPCIQGQTWGYDHNRIWVDHGCRADFVTGFRR